MGRVRLRLREWRERRRLSLRALAERGGVSYVTIVRIESGTLSPTIATVAKLATALGIDIREMFPVSTTHKRRRRAQ